MKKNKTIAKGLVTVLLAASASVCSAAVIITDTFSNPVGPLTTGMTLTPDYSAAGTVWNVVSGSYTTVGGAIVSGEGAGQLGSNTTNSVMRINFGDVAANSSAKISLGLRQWNGASPSTLYAFSMTIGDSTSGLSYRIVMALSPANFAAQGGGTSGFTITNPTTNTATASGVAGAYIGNTGAFFNGLVINFDPISGVNVTLNGVLAASLNYVPPGMTKIDYFSLNTSSPTLTWFMDNVQVDATLVPEPSTWALLGLAFVAALIWRKRLSA